MSKIKIMGLGGLNENGKNTYIVEINRDLFVFDCGLKYAKENLYGIDYIIPDFDYLVKNRKRIKGVFITHGHYENMGGVADLVKNIPEIKIYATKFTKFTLLNEGIDEKNIIEITPHKKISFRSCSIFPVSVSHSAPDSVMYIINTKDGIIAYTGDFLIDPRMPKHYDMDLGKISYIGKQGVLCLLSESTFSEKVGFTSPNHRLTEFFKDTINRSEGRVIFSLLPNHIYTIQEIFDAVVNTHRKVVIMGKKLHNVITFSKKEGYLNYNDNYIGDLNNLKDNKTVILIGDDKEKPYACIDRIVNGYDKFITLKENDTIVFAEPRYDHVEKRLVKLEDEIARMKAYSISIPKEKIILHHASSEDLLLMLKLLNPKYYMPVKGEYRYMVENANLASSIGMNKDNIILKQNGDVVSFVDGKLVNKQESIKVNDVLIDGNATDDVGQLVLKDREMLGESGIVLISATLNRRDKKIIVGPEVTTRGFIYVKDSKEMIDEIKKISVDVITRNSTDHYVDYSKIKVEIREELGKYLYHETECKPMIIAVVQEV